MHYRLPSAHALLNIETFIALGFLLTTLSRSRSGSDLRSDAVPGQYGVVFLVLCCAILTVYWPALRAPFVYDDYTHITDARDSTWRTVVASFGPVQHKPGLFFRPFGLLIYWLNYLVAGADAQAWHIASMVFHAASGCCSCFAGRCD